MEPPVATVTADASPLTTQHLMHDHGRGELFVLNEQREVLGVVTAESVAEAVRNGQTQLADALTTDVTAVSPETPIAELFTPAAHSGFPLAVVEPNRRLLGVIPQPALLASLGTNPRETEQLIQPQVTGKHLAPQVQRASSTAGVVDA
jgi:glycine betaine/proline transport system ATP-binding protein